MVSRKFNTGNIVWAFEYVWLNPTDTYPANSTLLTTTVAGSGTDKKMEIHEFSDVTGTGKTISSMVHFTIGRLGADAADTCTDAVWLHEFDIHFKLNTPGSVNATSK